MEMRTSPSDSAGLCSREPVSPETTSKHGDLIYDVGMHMGEDTDFYLQKGFRVVAFEADPELCQIGRRRFEKYIASGQLVLLEGAIQPESAPAESKVLFYKNEGNTVWGTTLTDWDGRNSRLGAPGVAIEVGIVDFRQAIRQFGMPRYMKIDIEGCDMVCVRVLKEFLPRPDFVSIESDKTRFSNIKDEIDTLESLGYKSFQAVEQSGIPMRQTPPNPAREGNYVSHTFPAGSSGLFGLELEGPWSTQHEILWRYRVIRLGYYLLGDDGIMVGWNSVVAKLVRRVTRRVLRSITRAAVPGWYDTHARHLAVAESPASQNGGPAVKL